MKRIKAIGHLLFSFRGRISRSMWWVAQLVAIIFMLLVGFPLVYVVLPRIENADVVFFLYWSALLLGTWTYFAISIKRLHDRNRSGGGGAARLYMLKLVNLFITEQSALRRAGTVIPFAIIRGFYLPHCANSFSAWKSGGKQIWSSAAVPESVVGLLNG